jgi:hypothetical protein
MAKKAYHGSARPLARGTILTGNRRDGYVRTEPVLEELFEKWRPEGAVSRYEAVFLCSKPDVIEDAGGSPAHIYLVAVEDDAAIERHDLAWYTQAQSYLSDGDRASAEDCAKAYWSGVRFHDATCSVWEFLTASARIVREWTDDTHPSTEPVSC